MPNYTDTLLLASEYTTRLGSTSKDVRFKNTHFDVADTSSGKRIYINKRPGVAVNAAAATGAGRGIYAWKGNIYKVVGSILYKNNTSIKSNLTNSTGLVQWTEEHLTDVLVFRDNDKIVTVTTGDTVTEQADAQIPTGLVPGIAYLDTYIFVMTSDGLIYNCDVDDITSWTAGNFISAVREPDDGVVLFKHHDYIGACGQWSTQFFWNASNPTGSPLLPVDGSTDSVGCASGTSLVTDGNISCWVARTQHGGPKVVKLEKMQITTVSNPFIDKILQLDTTNLDTSRAFGINIAGHFFYVLTLPTLDITLVYDVTTGLWAGEWNSDPGTEAHFAYLAATYNDGEVYLLHESNGDDYKMSTATYQDAGTDINVEIVSDLWRGPKGYESNKNKSINRLTILGDEQTSTSNVTLQITKDDYQNYSTARTVDMSKTDPSATQFGSVQSMGVRLQHAANTPLRVYGVEIDYTQHKYQGGNY